MVGVACAACRERADRSRPIRASIVDPGKLAVLARRPQSRLNSVVLPVLGFPISAKQPGSGCRAAPAPDDDATGSTLGGGRTVIASAMTASSSSGRLNQNARGKRFRNAQPRRTHLQNARLPDLAQADLAPIREAHRAEHLTISRAKVRMVQRSPLAPPQLGERPSARKCLIDRT